jgi:serine/threonine-protein kinase
MSNEAQALGMPPTLGRYELLLPIARGGMGQVWAGRLRGARGFNKLVAIKTVLPMEGSEGRLESMLLEEARIAALIHHPNVVQTIELGEHDDKLYLVMEWVDGEPLSFILERALERGGFPLPIAVNLVGQTLLGLQAAHELTDDAGALLGVVHRDVSPHNVLVSYSGVAKLVDFGIAKATNKDSSSTQTGEVKGKFSYMAPEQIRSEPVDRRTDIFAIGILLYTLTTGRHPFKADNPAGLIHKIAGEEPAARPSLSSPTYSRTLEAVLMKALEKDASKRWQSASEMLAALQRAFPAAFVAGFEAQIRDFMAALVGDRASLRRESLRRAQLAADSRTPSGSLPAATQSASQSASSLRALSVDRAPSDVPPQSISVVASLEQVPAAPVSRPRKGRGWVTAFGVATVLAIAILVFRIVARLEDTARSAAVSADAPEVTAHELRPNASLPHESVTAPSQPISSSNQPSTAPSESARPVASAGAPAQKVAVPSAKPRTQRSKSRDLIAPDYAR